MKSQRCKVLTLAEACAEFLARIVAHKTKAGYLRQSQSVCFP